MSNPIPTDKALSGNAAIIEPEDGVQEKLAVAKSENRPLRVKLGFDPTAPDLHLGHAVVLRKLREFQDFDHQIVVIVGDFTASIGDPTGRNKARPPLSKEAIETNSQTYLDQLSKVVDLEKIEVRRNSEWHGEMSLEKMLRVMAKVTLAQIMAREDFKSRFDQGVPIHSHEITYPLLQGYDSVMIDADIELGGTDQLFNNLMGRTLQKAFGKSGQTVLTMPLLVGLDGVEKMSKSKNNYVGLTDDPRTMFGKLMSISDDCLKDYIELATDFARETKSQLLLRVDAGHQIMDVKKRMARNVVTIYHNEIEAADAETHFERTVQKKIVEASDLVPILFSIDSTVRRVTLLEIVKKSVPNRSGKEIKQLFSGGGIRVDGAVEKDFRKERVAQGEIQIKVGKRANFKVSFAKS